MKIMNKIAAALLLGAAVFAFAGCKAEEEDENAMLTVKGSKCSIDYTNGGENNSRGFHSLKTKHYDAVCKISNLPNGEKDGVQGFIFDLYQNEDKSYNFIIAGVRKNGTKYQGYVTKFVNVGGKYLKNSADFCDLDGNKVNTAESKAKSKDLGSGYVSGFVALNDIEADPETKGWNVWIDVVANDGKSEGRTGDAGSYTVTFYANDPERKTAAAGAKITYNNAEKKSIFSVTIPAGGDDLTQSTGYTKYTQTDIGFYACTYPKSSLTGKWELSDIEGSGEPIEYLD